MEITSNGGTEFRHLAAKFKAAGKNGAAIRKALTREIQRELEPTKVDIQTTVRHLQVRGGRHLGGTTRRQAFHEVHRKRAARGGYGLRASVARGVKSKVSYTGRRIGARILIDTSMMPQSQRKLPAYMDGQGRWRHPVFGHRDRWVTQFGTPYFYVTIERHIKRMDANISAAVASVFKEL